jgi:hypothetical protein
VGLFDFIGSIFQPAVSLVDDLNTSDEERLKLRNELAKIQNGVTTKLIDLEKAKLDAMQKIQVAEAQSKHWLQGNWRPICSMTLLGLVVGGSFGWFSLDPKVYDIALYFLGLYGTGRSLEKGAAALKIGK